MQLYAITEALRSITDTDDGELTDEAAARLDALQLSLQDKVEDLRDRLDEYEMLIQRRKDRIAELRAMNDRDERDAEWLKGYVMGCLRAAGLDGVKTAFVSASICKSPPSARCVVDAHDLPESFQRVIPARCEPDAKAAIAFWKETGLIPVGFEITQGEHLRLR